MGIMEAVKNGFAKAGKLMNVIIVFFVFNAVVGLISLPLANPARAGNPGIVTVSIISSVLFFLIFIFLQGGALGLVKDLLKTGSASLAQFNGYGKKFYLRILGLLLLYVVIAVGIVLVLSLISAGLLLLGDNLVTRTIVALLVTVVAVAVITLLVYPIYALVADDIGSIESLKKGMLLAKANFVRTLALFMVLLLVRLLISLIVGFLMGLATVPLAVGISQIVITVINAAVQSYIPVVMMVAFMSFYMALVGGAQQAPSQAEVTE